jgi:uncharacterized protein YabE (DUF348 family)
MVRHEAALESAPADGVGQMRRGLKLTLGGTLGAALVAGTVVGWSFVNKSVTVLVDGSLTAKFDTISLDVRGALRDAGYPLAAHDDVIPAADSVLRQGAVIRLRRGRQLQLDVDGTTRAVWVTASTVASALADLGYSPQVYSAPPAATSLPLVPSELSVRTVKTVTLQRAGVTDTVDSTAASVGDLLADQGISPGPHDRLSVPPGTALSNGMMIVWQKVTHQTVVDKQTLRFTTTYRPDPTRPRGATTVAVFGRTGSIAVTYDLMSVDGKQLGKSETGRSTVLQPVAEVILVGSAVPTRSTPVKAARSHQPTGTPSRAVTTATPRPVARRATPVPAARPVISPPRRIVPVPRPAPKPVPKPVPKPAPKPVPPPSPPPITTIITVTPGSAQALASQMLAQWGWSPQQQWSCLQVMWANESGWRVDALNPWSGAYGIPQAFPGSRMAAAGSDWRTNPRTQIAWGLNYIQGRYGTPCVAWSFWQAHHWY